MRLGKFFILRLMSMIGLAGAIPYHVAVAQLDGAAIGSAFIAVDVGPTDVEPIPPEEKERFIEAFDPLEPINRGTLWVNRFVDGLLIAPVTKAYKAAMPAPVQTGVGNFFSNLAAPLQIVNFSLQGEGKKVGRQFTRFVCNTIFGLCGIFDVAGSCGLKKEETDFGTTLAKAGLPAGPYLILPLLGPSDVRDTMGQLVTAAADPFTRVAIRKGHRNLVYVRAGTQYIHTRSKYIKAQESLERNTGDYYVALRNLYYEHNKPVVKNAQYQGPRPSSKE